MSKKSVTRRQQFFVDPQAQTRWIVSTGGASIAVFFGCILGVLVASVIGDWYYYSLARAEVLFQDSLGFLAKTLTIPLVLASVFFCRASLRESFRILGPMRRHSWIYRQVKTRCIPRGVTTRDGDYLAEETAALNAALYTLHDDLAAMQLRGISVLQKVEALSDDSIGPIRSELQELVAQLNQYELESQVADAVIDESTPFSTNSSVQEESSLLHV